MGYARYKLPDGRLAGYAVEAVCDEAGCTAKIDRGLAYLCGSEPGGDEHGCGGYFCDSHLFFLVLPGVEDFPQRCKTCTDHVLAKHTDHGVRS